VEASRGNTDEFEAGASASTSAAGTVDAPQKVDAADRTVRSASSLGGSAG